MSSTVMKSDQTISLIQLYHQHYPEIARNTQDVEGRKVRTVMWAKIAEELNSIHSTNFSVEQFKKKVQNVQCTSRQKLTAGKRNLGGAELEYVKLFEGNADEQAEEGREICSTRFSSLHNRSLSSSRSNSVSEHQHAGPNEKVDTTDLSRMLEVVLDAANRSGGEAAEADSNSPLGSNAQNGDGAFDSTQQLILAAMQAAANANASSLAGMVTDGEGCLEVPQGDAAFASSVFRRRRKSLHRHQAEAADKHLAALKKKRRLAPPHFIYHSSQRPSPPANECMEAGWKESMLKMQQRIVDNQQRILSFIEEQHTARTSLQLSAHGPPSPPSSATPISTIASRLVNKTVGGDESSLAKQQILISTLCSRIEQLSSALLTINDTIKVHLPSPHFHKTDE